MSAVTVRLTATKCDLPITVPNVSSDDTLEIFLAKLKEESQDAYGGLAREFFDCEYKLTTGNGDLVETDAQWKAALVARARLQLRPLRP